VESRCAVGIGELPKFFENPGTIEDLVRAIFKAGGITDEQIASNSAILREHLPEWEQDPDGIDNYVRLIHCLERRCQEKFGDLPEEQRDYNSLFPEHVNNAIGIVVIGVFANYCRQIAKRYFDGLSFTEAVQKVVTVFVTSVEGRRKGGEATTKFTNEVRALAAPLFAQFLRSNLSTDAASNRTAARLESEHGIEISPKTIKRHLSKDNLDNA